MGLIAKDLPSLVFMLLPGFIASGIFFSLTAHPKTSEFERVIQALIFTSLLKFLTIIIKGSLFAIGLLDRPDQWTNDFELVLSIFLAIPLGLVFVHFANNDTLHRLLRERKLTNRTSYPSEWYGALNRETSLVVLHLADGRRLYGWPEEVPDQSDKGHFVIARPEWLLDNNDRAPLYRVKRIMVPAGDVKMIEFMKEEEEILEDPAEIARVDQLLIEAQPKETTDGSQDATAGTEPSEHE